MRKPRPSFGYGRVNPDDPKRKVTDRQIAIVRRLYQLADQGVPLGEVLERLIDSERRVSDHD
jgi:hypothetical protein